MFIVRASGANVQRSTVNAEEEALFIARSSPPRSLPHLRRQKGGRWTRRLGPSLQRAVALPAGQSPYLKGLLMLTNMTPLTGAKLKLEIRVDDLRRPEVIALLQEHLRCMAEASPPESRHALDVEGLREPDVTFWTIWHDAELAGCGALKQLTPEHGEVKSMRTAGAYLRKGVASLMLRHLIKEAKRRGYTRLSLETGSMAYFEPARRLYASFGFDVCPPFASYREDPHSIFMTRWLKDVDDLAC